jgi:hypothetical protein
LALLGNDYFYIIINDKFHLITSFLKYPNIVRAVGLVENPTYSYCDRFLILYLKYNTI